MKGEGAIVFLLVFVVGLGLTLSSPTLPPGMSLYRMLNVPETSFPTLGIPVTTLVSGVLNGVVYGVVVWLLFTLVRRGSK
jgi:di/tricarboxylate transporter